MELFSVSHAFSNYLPNYKDQEYKENGLYFAESCVLVRDAQMTGKPCNNTKQSSVKVLRHMKYGAIILIVGR